MSEAIEIAISAEWKVAIFRKIFTDPLVEKFMQLLHELAKTVPVPSQALRCYYEFATAFIPYAVDLEAADSTAWQNYIRKLILTDENIFSRQAESRSFDEIPLAIKRMAEQDLAILEQLAAISNKKVKKLLRQRMGKLIEDDKLPDWEGLSDNLQEFEAVEWPGDLHGLYLYYRQKGVGIFGQYHAFRWVRNKNGEGSLVGVQNMDRIRLSQLYEYEREQTKVIQNTEQFLAGYPANNILLYGDRGTGKSSTVKALINEYGEKGLRLVEVQKQDLEDYPQIITQLATRPQRFIIFIDDLSFTQDEGEYRALKAMLEGSLEARPANVLIYATSNRRHLVQESFSDKKITGYDLDNDDIRYMDTMQEKLSLADRFGITVTFAAPDQKRYLVIVEKMARERGLKIESDELAERALKWELNNNSRSARTARQFVDFLEGQLALITKKKRR